MSRKVIVRIDGGLGNQLFEYALARGVADRIGARIVLDVSRYWFNRFRRLDIYAFMGPYNETSRVLNWKYSFALGTLRMVIGRLFPRRVYDWFEHVTYRLLHIEVVEADSPWVYNQLFEKLSLANGDNLYIRGIYQYLPVLADTGVLQRSFATVKTPEPATKRLIDEIKDAISVSVHVRRGDYVALGAQSMVLPIDYYRRAMKKIIETVYPDIPKFYFFSDDPVWCKATFSDVDHAVFMSGNTTSPIDDLTLMRACKHHIIANSTFSFWGAYLGEADNTITIYPERWMSDFKTVPTMVPPTWVSIESWKNN